MTTIDLKLFCAAADDYRSHLHTPALTAHGICATNGHILICVPGTDAPDTWADNLKQSIEKFAALPVSADAIPMDHTLILPPLTPCPSCSGTGHSWQLQCDECDGEGTFKHCRYWYTCQKCDGDGFTKAKESTLGAKKIVCGRCSGSDHDSHQTAEPVGNAHFQPRYLALLKTLPNCRLQPGGEGPAKFTFDGGWGALMPVRP